MLTFYRSHYSKNQMHILHHALLEAKMYVCDYANFDCEKCKNKRICSDICRVVDFLKNASVENSVENVENKTLSEE